MNARPYFRLLAAALALVVVTAGAADLTVIDLRNRTADDVIPALRPLVGPEVALSGIDYKLLVRGTADDVAHIREALTVLDRTPRQLLVSVRYTGQPQGNSTDLGVGGTITNSGSQINVHAGTTTRTAVDSSVSSVRVLEGNGAHIAVGQSVPIVTGVLLPLRSRRQTGVGGVATDYHELTSGFDVLPRVNGDRVMLDIATQQERPTNTGQAASVVHRATTTVAGRLGEWIELGGVTTSISEQTTGVGLAGGARSITTQSDQRSVAVKVEQLE